MELPEEDQSKQVLSNGRCAAEEKKKKEYTIQARWKGRRMVTGSSAISASGKRPGTPAVNVFINASESSQVTQVVKDPLL